MHDADDTLPPDPAGDRRRRVIGIVVLVAAPLAGALFLWAWIRSTSPDAVKRWIHRPPAAQAR